MRKFLKYTAGALAVVIAIVIAAFIATGPAQPPADSPSAAWLQSGPYAVGSAEFTFIDTSRPTSANRDAPAKPERTFLTTVWYPEAAETELGEYPLIVHSHGILSNRNEMPYLMQALASNGYVVLATDYPLSSGGTEGGATPNDVGNQAGDIHFLINSVLDLSGEEKPFNGSIDATRIGLSGYSLGGLTTNIATYHTRLREPRIKAAVSIAGVAAPFSPTFFTTTDIPYLAIAGTADALIEYRRQAADLPDKVSNASLITIDRGSHLGFLGAADPTFRFMGNPDSIGCSGVLAVVGDDPNASFATLGTVEEGIDTQRDLPGLCKDELLDALHPGRQRMITQIAVLSFFESVFNPDRTRRDQAWRELTQHLAADFPESSYRGRY